MPMPSADRELHWSWLGRVPYVEATAMQEHAREELRGGRGPERLLLLEHSPVYTLGRSASAADIVASREWLAARGVEVHECDRGGQVTYHGPGQLVGYPILDLSPDRRDVRRYVRDLQQVLVDTLAELGVAAEGRHAAPEIGVWVGERKIASLGVHLSRWITTHGFALNVATDLSMFQGIVACGLSGVRMTSVRELLGTAPDLEHLADLCASNLARIFRRRAVAAAAPPLRAAST